MPSRHGSQFWLDLNRHHATNPSRSWVGLLGGLTVEVVEAYKLQIGAGASNLQYAWREGFGDKK